MKFNIIAVAVGLLALAGCGISDDTLLTDIDSDLWAKVCAKVAEAQPAVDEECEGYTLEADAMTEAQHEAACNTAWGATSGWTGCTATFGDWIDLNEYEEADLCSPNANPPGYNVIECLMDAM